jgi:hypothetical protein
MIFQSTIDTLEADIRELQQQIEAKNQRQNELIHLEAVADSAIDTLQETISKIQFAVPDAIASLKSAVMGLFPSDGNDGGNQPDEPTPDPDEPDTALIVVGIATNGAVEADFAVDNPMESHHVITSNAKLDGRSCTVEYPQPEAEKPTYTEFVKVSDRIAYIKVSHSGEIKSTYIGFNNKSRAKSWANYLEALTPSIELRAAKRMGDWKHELKIRGLSAQQIERLTTEDFSKTFKAEKPQTAQPDEFEPGDVVVQSLTPSASFKIIEVMPNGVLDCENLTTGDRQGLRPSAVQLVQKASTETPYLVTSGNYTGLAKQTRQRWERLGIDPQELIAQMREKRPPEPEWNAAKYNPLAAVGADDASDF